MAGSVVDIAHKLQQWRVVSAHYLFRAPTVGEVMSKLYMWISPSGCVGLERHREPWRTTSSTNNIRLNTAADSSRQQGMEAGSKKHSVDGWPPTPGRGPFKHSEASKVTKHQQGRFSASGKKKQQQPCLGAVNKSSQRGLQLLCLYTNTAWEKKTHHMETLTCTEYAHCYQRPGTKKMKNILNYDHMTRATI